MPYDDEDDLFEEDFDFVDEEDEEDAAKPAEGDDPSDDDAESDEAEPAAPSKPKRRSGQRGKQQSPTASSKAEAEPAPSTDQTQGDKPSEEVEKPEPEGPPTDHVVYVYECGEYKRTIAREFTDDDAAAFVVEYNRTSAAHSREAVAASRGEEPAPSR